MRHSETDWIILSTSRTFPFSLARLATNLSTPSKETCIFRNKMFEERGMARLSLPFRVSLTREKEIQGQMISLPEIWLWNEDVLFGAPATGNRERNATFFWWFVLSWIMRFRIGGWAAEDVSLDAYCFFFRPVKQKERSLVTSPVYFSISNPISTRWRTFSFSLSRSLALWANFFFLLHSLQTFPWIPRVPLDSHSSSPSRHSS